MKTKCEVCDGERGHVGDENVINDIVVCGSCYTAISRDKRLWGLVKKFSVLKKEASYSKAELDRWKFVEPNANSLLNERDARIERQQNELHRLNNKIVTLKQELENAIEPAVVNAIVANSQRAYRQLEDKIRELEALFDMQRDCLARARAFWQQETGTVNIFPGLEEVLDWLMIKAGLIGSPSNVS